MNDLAGVATASVFESFPEAEAAWRSAEVRCASSPYQHFDWLSRWHEEAGAPRGVRPRIVLVSDEDGAPLLLMPLGLHSVLGTRVLTWLGQDVNGFNAPLVHPRALERLGEQGIEDLWRFIRTEVGAEAVHFERQPQFVGTVPNPVHSEAAWLATGDHVSQQAFLGDSWDAYYEAALPLKLRKDNARRWRRLAERGEVRYVTASDPQQALRITERMIAEKRRQFAATGFPDQFQDERDRRFYRRVAAECLESGLVHVSAITCDDEIIATHWGLVADGWMFGAFSGHETGEWDRYAAGHLLRTHVLQDCIANGIHTYDFSVGEEPYKEHWSNQRIPTVDELAALTLRGQAYALPRTLHREAKRLAMEVTPVRRAARGMKRRARRYLAGAGDGGNARPA